MSPANIKGLLSHADPHDHDRRKQDLRQHVADLVGERQMLEAKEVAEFLAITVSHVYTLMRADAMPHLKVGAAYRIPVSWLIDWLVDGGSTSAESAPHMPPRSRGGRSTRRWAT